MKIARGRVVFFTIAFLLALLSAYFGQPLIHNNDKAQNIIVTVFSILAGFLVAIMTLLADPSSMARASWRGVEVKRGQVFVSLVRQKWLFFLYLVTLGLLTFASLIEKSWPEAVPFLEYMYIFFAVLAFMLSLRLPTALMDIQLARFDELLTMKRKAAGISDNEKEQR